MRGASMRAVSELLGHQSMQMTLRYAHLSPGYLKNEVSLLDDIGAKKGQQKGNVASTA
jgi:integrase